MHHSSLDLLHHMADEALFCLKEVRDMPFSEFINDEKLMRAVTRSLEIIGEATKKIKPDFKSKYPLVEWKAMAGMRDRLIHDYFGVDYEMVYKTVQNDIPELKEWLDIIFENENK